MLSMKRHAHSGHTVNNDHFTGKQRTGSKRKQQLTKRQKNAKKGTHINKYVA